MKATLTFLAALNLLTVLAQKQQVAIEFPEYDIIFRGYDNQIKLAVDKIDPSKLKIVGEGCEAQKSGEANTYILRVKTPEKTASIAVLMVDGKQTDTLTTKNFRVMNLPVPELYLDNRVSGDSVNSSTHELVIGYPAEFPIHLDVTIKAWEVNLNGKIISGSGNVLTGLETYFAKNSLPLTLQVSVKFVTPDGPMRIVTGKWLITGWKD